MKVVIDIDENIYRKFIMGFANEDDSILIGKLFNNGTVLPKGHGRLVDVEDIVLTEEIYNHEEFILGAYVNDTYIAISAPTIIEEDKEVM